MLMTRTARAKKKGNQMRRGYLDLFVPERYQTADCLLGFTSDVMPILDRGSPLPEAGQSINALCLYKV
jgi:hypothetical protein